MTLLRIFTDGACSDNPGPGGWATIVNLDEGQYILGGNELQTTNNRMELIAVIEALKTGLRLIHKEVGHEHYQKIEVSSDSAYVVNAINRDWLTKWKLNGFKTTKQKDVKNSDLWLRLDKALRLANKLGTKVAVEKIKGHSGNTFNEMADEEARRQVTLAKERLVKISKSK